MSFTLQWFLNRGTGATNGTRGIRRDEQLLCLCWYSVPVVLIVVLLYIHQPQSKHWV